MAIVRNAARCDMCGDEIESTHRHDFKSCSCGNISVDGGKDYFRRGWGGGPYTDLSEFTEAHDPERIR